MEPASAHQTEHHPLYLWTDAGVCASGIAVVSLEEGAVAPQIYLNKKDKTKSSREKSQGLFWKG